MAGEAILTITEVAALAEKLRPNFIRAMRTEVYSHGSITELFYLRYGTWSKDDWETCCSSWEEALSDAERNPLI